MFNSQADAKRIEELKSQLAAAEARIDAQDAEKIRLQAEIERVDDELLTVRAETQKANRIRGEMEAEIAKTKEETAASKAALQTANAKLATFDTEVETAAAARFAGLGGDPLPAAGNDDPAKASSGLTGLERATAAHKAAARKN